MKYVWTVYTSVRVYSSVGNHTEQIQFESGTEQNCAVVPVCVGGGKGWALRGRL